jgi:GDP-4-dehydro-6-deoxy-D-mannose reductase
VRVLITGASGFAGGYLARACAAAGDEVLGVSRRGSVPHGCASMALELGELQAARELVASFRPQVVYHLAALTSVGRSWEDPAETVQGNVAGDLAVLEAIRHEAPGARVVWVSSCQVYGVPDALPAAEDAELRPDNPYGVAKAAGDMLAAVYADAHRLDLVRARPFNHTGPGQPSAFIASSLAFQGARARLAGATRIRVETGNPETRRDFTDVRDVVRAYRGLAERSGDRGVYNVSSSASISAAEQVRLLGELIAPIEVEHVVDPALARAHEVMDLRGDNHRIAAATGWHPEIPFRQTMSDTIAWWESKLRTGAAAGAGSAGSAPAERESADSASSGVRH